MKMGNAKMKFFLFENKTTTKSGFAYDITHLFVNQRENSNPKILLL